MTPYRRSLSGAGGTSRDSVKACYTWQNGVKAISRDGLSTNRAWLVFHVLRALMNGSPLEKLALDCLIMIKIKYAIYASYQEEHKLLIT